MRVTPAIVFATAVLCGASIAGARRVDTLVSGSDFASIVAWDAAENLYVFYKGKSRVARVSPAGAVTQMIGPSGDGLGHTFDAPGSPGYICNMIVTPAGVVYVTAGGTNNVFQIDVAGVVTEMIGPAGDGAGNVLEHPFGLAVDANGNLFVAGIRSKNVFRITPSGTVSEIIDGLDAFIPRLAADAFGNVFIGDDELIRYAPGGSLTTLLDATGDGAGNPLSTFIVTPVIDAAGNVYVHGEGSNNVFKVDPGGNIMLLIDASGDGLGNTLEAPQPPVVDSQGVVYVLGFGKLFRIPPGGSAELMPNVHGGSRLLGDAADRVYVLSALRLAVVTEQGTRTLLDTHGDGLTSGVTYLLSETALPGIGAGTALGTNVIYHPVTEVPGNTYAVMRVHTLCDATARAECRHPTMPQASILTVKALLDESRDSLKWKWTRGGAQDEGAFGDPSALDYSFCIYGGGTLLFEASAPEGASCGGGSCWTAQPGKGFTYTALEQAPDGIRKIVLRAGVDGKAKVTLQARAGNLPDDLRHPIDVFPLTAQLQASNGECWEAVYAATDATRNLETKLVVRGQ